MGLVMCAVDRSEEATKVLEAAKATGEPVLAVHVSNSLLGTAVPAFLEHPDTDRHIEHGPTGDGLLRAAARHQPELIVMGTRGRLWPSVARYVARRAPCPVLVVGPEADPVAEPVTLDGFDRGRLRRATAPVLIAPA
jgi:nucleotide-binding universal stress UspA family protein